MRSDRHLARLLLSALVAAGGLLAHSAQAGDSPRSFRFEGVEPVVAIGDVHGAYDALNDILAESGVVDAKGRWALGDGHLVLLGDLIDRGPRSTDVLERAMRLQREAREAGGRVHLLLGNHEVLVLVGDLRYVHPNDYARFADDETERVRDRAFRKLVRRDKLYGDVQRIARAKFYREHPEGFFAHREAFSPEGRYGSWLLQQKVMVVLNEVLFVHGGLGPPLEGLSVTEINERAMEELRQMLELEQQLRDADVLLASDEFRYKVQRLKAVLDYPSLVGRPGPRSQMVTHAALRLLRLYDEGLVMREDGPLWYRGSILDQKDEERRRLEASLDRLDAEAVVVGHTPSHTGRVAAHHGGRVIQLDTGMLTSQYQGRASALRLADGKLSVVYPGEEPKALAGVLAERPGPFDDAAAERFLETAEVVAREEVGAGSTEPQRITLRANGETHRAIFKTASAPADGDSDGPPLHYRHEVAAYRVARLLGLDLVPPTVLREIDGEQGSLQLWVEGAISEEGRLAEDLEPPDEAPYRFQGARMHAFDALIHNHERDASNILITTDDWRLHLIDHARSFGTDCSRPPNLEEIPLAVDDALAQRLAELDRKTLSRELDGLLTDDEIDALLARRDALLAAQSSSS
jgi:3',5'-cyclic AMP phosphodiesterase CpdA